MPNLTSQFEQRKQYWKDQGSSQEEAIEKALQGMMNNLENAERVVRYHDWLSERDTICNSFVRTCRQSVVYCQH